MKRVFRQREFAAVILSIIGTLSICACSQAIDEIKVIDVGNAYEVRQPVMASDYFESIEYVPLETNESSLLNGSNEIDLAPLDDRIIVLSRVVQSPENFVRSFDYEGRQLEFNAQYGRSNQEYANLRRIIPAADELYFIQSSGIIKIYDLYGNYRGVIEPEVSIPVLNKPFLVAERTFGILGDDVIGKTLAIDIITPEGKRIIGKPIFSYQEEVKERAVVRNGRVLPIPSMNKSAFYMKENEKLFFVARGVDTLYTIDDGFGSKSASYLFDYGKYAETTSFKRILSIIDTDRFLLFRALFSRDLYNPQTGYLSPPFIYDEITGKTRILPYDSETGLNGFTNDINDDALIFYPKVCHKNKMYQVIDAIDFIDIAQRSNSSKIKEVAAELTEESNPVLVIATLKQ